MRMLLASIVLAGTLSCRATGAAGEMESVSITVTNDVNRGSAAISIIPEGGIEQQLGSVGGSDTQRLTFTGSTAARRFRLRAAIAGVSDTVSDIFYIPSGTGVAWSLRANYIRTTR
jgi:hypothetical protein